MTLLPSPRRSLALLVPTLLLAACATARMPPPADLPSGTEVLDVGNRSRMTGLLVDESFDLGPYQVRQVKRDLNSAGSVSIGSVSQERSRQGFQFRFIGGEEWQGHCELKTRDTALQANPTLRLEDSRARLACSCNSPTRSASLHLDDNWRPLQGHMDTGDGKRLEMRQVAFGQGDGGLRSPAMGYRVQGADGRTVAAAEVLYPGRIWRQSAQPADQREPQACLLSALMIYGPQ